MANELFDDYGRPIQQVRKLTSAWKTATIANGASISVEVDLGEPFNEVLIILPDMTNATATVQVAAASGGTFATLYGWYLGVPADIAIPKQRASIVRIGGAQFLKIDVAENEGSERTISIRGV